MQTTFWRNYHDIHSDNGHSVAGSIKISQALYSPELHNRRDILVYLPPSYGSARRRYPVLYMHDGQNLFDQATSYAGEWYVDETMEALSQQEGLEAIVVGISNAGARRQDEYSPFPDPRHGGGLGNQYLTFVVQTVKPLIDHDFYTLPDRRNTGIMGSSMGGLISLYAFFRHTDVFGFAGVMSPSFWFAGGSIYRYVEAAHFHPGKIYLDAGTREYGGLRPVTLAQRARSRRYYASVRSMKRLLVRKGYLPVRDLMHIEDRDANHSEDSWARRLPQAIRFFLKHTDATAA